MTVSESHNITRDIRQNSAFCCYVLRERWMRETERKANKVTTIKLIVQILRSTAYWFTLSLYKICACVANNWIYINDLSRLNINTYAWITRYTKSQLREGCVRKVLFAVPYLGIVAAVFYVRSFPQKSIALRYVARFILRYPGKPRVTISNAYLSSIYVSEIQFYDCVLYTYTIWTEK